jgi:APA family basic amino acid/polyamine antiporter
MSLFATKPVSRILQESEGGEHTLKRSLNALNLITLGIGAIIGAGIFTLAGTAAADHAGPAITLSFIFAGIGCAFAGFCYSEFATMIPIAGSAYTYSYATMGEFLAWIIGWDLVLEYAVGAATVSVGWSATLVDLLGRSGIHLPASLTASPWDATPGLINLPAVFIVALISFILMLGIQESARVNNVVVVLKVAVILIFIAVGWQFINPENYSNYIPANEGPGRFGWEGVLRGSGMIFFAYIGFDAVSTAAQEAKNPKRDMPLGIIGSLLICTVLFILYSHVLTGVVNYRELSVASPLAVALQRIPYGWLGTAMQLAVLAGLTSVILVMLLGQSRVFFSMSRDGLLPNLFSDIHPRWRTPWKSNMMFMVFVSVFAAFAPIQVVGQMTSIGTLFAFVLVCGGIWIMRRTHPDMPRPFRTPLVPFIPLLGILVNLALMIGLGWSNWLRLIIWLVIGLVIYFGYSRKHSHLRQGETAPIRR